MTSHVVGLYRYLDTKARKSIECLFINIMNSMRFCLVFIKTWFVKNRGSKVYIGCHFIQCNTFKVVLFTIRLNFLHLYTACDKNVDLL